GVRSRSVVAGAGTPAPKGPRASLGGRQARTVLAGRGRGSAGEAGRHRRRQACPGARWTACRPGPSEHHESAARRRGAVAATSVVGDRNRELIMVIEQLGREKGIDEEILFEALEPALHSASRKSLGRADNVRLAIDRTRGQ